MPTSLSLGQRYSLRPAWSWDLGPRNFLRVLLQTDDSIPAAGNHKIVRLIERLTWDTQRVQEFYVWVAMFADLVRP